MGTLQPELFSAEDSVTPSLDPAASTPLDLGMCMLPGAGVADPEEVPEDPVERGEWMFKRPACLELTHNWVRYRGVWAQESVEYIGTP